MRNPIALIALAALLMSSPAYAQKDRQSPLLGEWSVDVSRLPIPPQARPKSVTITFSRTQVGALMTQVEVIDSTGGRAFAEGTSTPDGKPVSVRGNLEADMAAAMMPAPDVLVMQLSRGGMPASTRVYSVAEGGKSMVETVAYFDNEGRPALRTNYFDRVK